MVSIAERVGTTVGKIVAKTTEVVEDATRSLKAKKKVVAKPRPATSRKSNRGAAAGAGAKKKTKTVASGKPMPPKRKAAPKK